MKHAWIVTWGFYSSYEGGTELKAVCTSYDEAMDIILKEIRESRRAFEQRKAKNSGELLDCWCDGDYWISISKVNTNTEWMYGEPE